MPRPQPYDTYQGVQIFLYQEVGGKPNEWGVLIRWQRQLIDVERAHGTGPTLENMLSAAYQLIDVLNAEQGKKVSAPGIKRTWG